MSPPPFQEEHISQIPALQFLQRLGYRYLTPEEVTLERKGRTGSVLLEGILREQLRRLNRIRFKGREESFSEENISRAVEALAEIPYEGLVRTSEKVYDLLTLGKSLEQEINGESKGFTLRYIDWESPHNNTFHVVAEFGIERAKTHDLRRPDIVCFVNGIPFVVIECKQPVKDALDEAISQHLRNQNDENIPKLFVYAQLLLALSKNDALYGTTGTARKFWALWKEPRDVGPEVSAFTRGTGPVSEHEKLFAGRFAYTKDFFEELMVEGRQPTGQDIALYCLCRPERLIELTRQFIVYDEGGRVKKIARYQQYFTVQEAVARIRQRDRSGRRKGGVIWHTQGSGKSLTMVMLGKALALDRDIPNPRIVLVTDRIDLDDQIWKTFHQCGKDPVQAKTGKHLIELLQDERVPVVTTVIDKFRAASLSRSRYMNPDADIFVLVDESHRSQYGQANIRMQKTLPNACFIGFTGTPLMKDEKNTAKRFGGFIEPAYTIRDAVKDQAVVPLLYEGRHILQEVNRKAVDRMFEGLSEGLSPEQKADLKRKFASRDELNKLESKLYLVAWDVSEHYSKNWKGTGFKAQLTAPGKLAAIRLKEFLDEFGKVTSEVVISPPDEREGNDDVETAGDEKVQAFWSRMMARYGSEKEYLQQVVNSFKHGDDPELIIVVEKLLTGFDAPRNRTLYIARSLKEHNLLQAIARVNRLYPGKDYGQIIDYYGVVTYLHEALELYGSLEGKFDAEDLAGALFDVKEELAKLPASHDAVWEIFKEVRNKKDEEAFEVALAGEELREEFYARLSRFSRLLKLALGTLQWVQETPEDRIDRYKNDLRFFQGIRVAVKIRYGEEIDYRDYERQIQKMLSTYVQSDEVMQVNEPVNIFEREEFEKQVEKAKSTRAKADTIANRTKKTISERMGEDPYFYRKFSRLLQDVIDDYRAQRIDELKYLAKVTEIMEKIRNRREEDVPAEIASNGFAKALYGIVMKLVESTPETKLDEKIALETARAMEKAIQENATVRWRENADAQNAMRNQIDDFLYGLVRTRQVRLSFDMMDELVEGALEIARNREEDV